MPEGPSQHSPLAMRLWLAWRYGRVGRAFTSLAATSRASGKTMRIESLEHIVRSRVRMFLRHTWLATILGTVILAGGLWAAFYFTSKATVMKIAAGPAGGADARLVQILAEKFVQERDKTRLQLVATAGSAQSAQAIADGKADLAILPSTVGTSPDWPVVAIMRQNVMAFIVPALAAGEPAAKGKNTKSTKSKDAKEKKGKKSNKEAKAAGADENEDSGKLEKVSQLAGHRIGIVTGSDATVNLLDLVLKHYGVAPDKVRVSQIDPKNLIGAIHDKQVDAIFVAGPATGHAIGEAVAAATAKDEAPGFIAIDQADGIAKRDPAFDSLEIDAGTFGGGPPTPDDSLKTLSFPEYLVARKSLGHEQVASLARLIYSSRLSLAAELPGEVKIEAPSTDKDAAVIVHPGALAYLGDDQKSFFDKYGDDIFYGLLIFPVFGSAIAGAASYFRNNGRTRRLRLLQHLLDLTRKAHAASSLQALDQLEVDVDKLLVAIIHQSEREEYDQAVQMSFSFALDQVRFAIAGRRAVLLDHLGAEAKSGTKIAAE
ncbi:MAG TPA: TAXI family TRAP transporter solute-binding subunit [Xanthobacteraceae bacterium]|nr:TAXI family TRAP transporter solute-binding subunit [Xanthobacteraceae bacterium]